MNGCDDPVPSANDADYRLNNGNDDVLREMNGSGDPVLSTKDADTDDKDDMQRVAPIYADRSSVNTDRPDQPGQCLTDN